ncbi:MAG: hypothetical protein RR280_05225 [Bacteroidaceae bacterium]
MKKVFRMTSSLFLLLAFALVGTQLTSCSDDDDETKSKSCYYTTDFESMSSSSDDMMAEIRLIESTFLKKNGVKEKPFKLIGSDCDGTVKKACQEAEAELKDKKWNGKYVYTVVNMSTGKNVYTYEIK